MYTFDKYPFFEKKIEKFYFFVFCFTERYVSTTASTTCAEVNTGKVYVIFYPS